MALCGGQQQDFNPRSREGSDHVDGRMDFRGHISIHAPVKGATCDQPSHRAKRGHFNPRSREGSDPIMSFFDPVIMISIHAPVKGATCLTCGRVFNSTYFNPRSREGSDNVLDGVIQARNHFNPRSREGSDFRRSRNSGQLLISIHAPVKGATIAFAVSGAMA